jgi:hypothetical protein
MDEKQQAKVVTDWNGVPSVMAMLRDMMLERIASDFDRRARGLTGADIRKCFDLNPNFLERR